MGTPRCRPALLIAVLIVLSMLTACKKEPATGAKQPPPPLPMHGPGEVNPQACSASQGHGTPGQYKQVDCPEACTSSVSDHQYVVDGYVNAIESGTPDYGLDPDICLHGTNDTLTYITNKTGRTIQVMRFESANLEAHPFVDTGTNQGPPYPHSAPGTSAKTDIMEPGRRPVHPASGKGKCYMFEAFIAVTENGATRCFDPHIYTDCSPSCTQ